MQFMPKKVTFLIYSQLPGVSARSFPLSTKINYNYSISHKPVKPWTLSVQCKWKLKCAVCLLKDDSEEKVSVWPPILFWDSILISLIHQQNTHCSNRHTNCLLSQTFNRTYATIKWIFFFIFHNYKVELVTYKKW